MKNYLFFILLGLLNLNTFGQGRKIDGQIITLTPQPNDTITSRKNAFYYASFIVRNNGPDTLIFYDTYSIKVQFSNVPYPPYTKAFNKTLRPGEQDTITFKLQMTWDTDAIGASFCATLTLAGPSVDSIKKETKDISANNKYCILVNHKSKLSITEVMNHQILFYPNPSNGKFYLKSGDAINQDYQIILLDMSGKIIESKFLQMQKSEIPFDYSYLKPGIYILQLKYSDGLYFTKIIIN